MNRKIIAHLLFVLAFYCPIGAPKALAQGAQQLLSQIQKLDARVLQDRPNQQLSQMLEKKLQEGLAAANRRSPQEWRQIANRDQWESYKRRRLEALRTSLGRFPDIPKEPRRLITKTLRGDGFVCG